MNIAADPKSKGLGALADDIMYLFSDWMCPEKSNRTDPLVSPAFAGREDLTGLPPAILCMADNDNLKAEGFRYVDMLKNAGVPVAATMLPDMPHGFFEYGFGEVTPKVHRFSGSAHAKADPQRGGRWRS